MKRVCDLMSRSVRTLERNDKLAMADTLMRRDRAQIVGTIPVLVSLNARHAACCISTYDAFAGRNTV